MEQEKRVNVGHCVLILYLSQDDLESCRRDTVQSETPGGAYLICIVFIVYQHPCLLLIHRSVVTSDIVIKLINVLDKGSPSWTTGRCISGFSTEIQDMNVLHRFTA